jgi:hypothetical protein
VTDVTEVEEMDTSMLKRKAEAISANKDSFSRIKTPDILLKDVLLKLGKQNGAGSTWKSHHWR